MSQFIRLNHAYAITVGTRLLPGVGQYGLGAVAVVMPDEDSALSFLESMSDEIDELGLGEAGLQPVSDAWAFMRRAAGEGLVGIEGATSDSFPERFMFMIRVEEAGSTLPTVIASITSEGWDTCLTRSGIQTLGHADLLHWQRFDIIDNVTGQWGLKCPFRSWDDGDVLFEIASATDVVLLADIPLLGDWNSTDGAFAFFTSEEHAEYFLRNRLGDGRNRMLSIVKSAPEDPYVAMGNLRPHVVTDLHSRLTELCKYAPLAAWCVNPSSHREDSGYGRLHYGGKHPVALQNDGLITFRMASVSGIWRLKPNNTFELEKPFHPWTGKDTIRWSGGQSLQLLQLDRSFVLDPDVSALGETHDFTDTDAEELISDYLDVPDDYDDVWECEQERVSKLTDDLDKFYFVCWDSVTGEGGDYPWTFTGFLAAVRYLACYERDHDRQHRIYGAQSCSHIGFVGSGNDEFEELRSARFVLGLRRLLLRVLRRGNYQPADGADLVALCNGTLSTLHVDYAGFAKDLLWASTSEQQEKILDDLDISNDDLADWLETTSLIFDPMGERFAKDRITESDWNALHPKSRYFIATALLHMANQGHAPQLDYAPISLEVVKALEVELGDILSGLKNANLPIPFQFNDSDNAEKSLVTYLKGGKAPTLGSMAYILGKPKGNASQLRSIVYDYLKQLPDGDFLISNEFANHGLHRVVHKYRNGGAHDSAIPESTCIECIETLIGTKENPGYIPRVARWRSGESL